jgi:hypothetical protein
MSLVDEAREVRERIAARLLELEPLVREYDELQQMATEMGLDEEEPSPAPARVVRPASSARLPARTRRTPQRKRRAARAGEHSAEGDLAGQVLAAVKSDPGKTVADYALSLGVASTALYRPVRQLTTEGSVVKRARQLFPG